LQLRSAGLILIDGEDRSGDDAACRAANSCNDDIFEESRSAPVDASEADRQD
jgi:hypothetical protein